MGINQIPREHEPVELPPYFDDFQDYKNFCVYYRGDLARIVKLTAGLLPEQALAAASRRLQNALQQCSTTSSPPVVSPLLSVQLPPHICECHLSNAGLASMMCCSVRFMRYLHCLAVVAMLKRLTCFIKVQRPLTGMIRVLAGLTQKSDSWLCFQSVGMSRSDLPCPCGESVLCTEHDCRTADINMLTT